MKKSIIIFCLLMMVGFIGISYAQDAAAEKPVLTADQQQAVDDAISMDPKLSAEEIEHLKIAVLGAPTKAEELNDPKLQTQREVVSAPRNAEPIDERELALPQPVEPTSLTTIPTGTQPIPATSDNVVKYQNQKGPATQEMPPKSEKVLILHNIKGPHTQPEPKKPAGK